MKPQKDEEKSFRFCHQAARVLIHRAGSISPMNIVNEEGDWRDWSRSLSSRVLSKQSTALAKRQLDLAFVTRKDELAEIMRLIESCR